MIWGRLLVCAALAGVVFFATSVDARGDDEAEAAIRAAGAAYVEAVGRNDANAVLALWKPGGTYTDASGTTLDAHEMIKGQFSDAGTDASEARLVVDDASSIRFVTDEVAVEEGTCTQMQGDAAVGRVSFSAIWIATDDGWKLESLRERALDAPMAANRLAPLAWMIGEWIAEGDDYLVRCLARFSENGHFILRDFAIEHGGSRVLSESQRIGWDAERGRIRSWDFDSEGSIIEGRWHNEGPAWIVRTDGVLADGSETSAVSFWLPEGDDRCVVRTTHMQIGEVAVDDVTIEFRRVGSAGASGDN